MSLTSKLQHLKQILKRFDRVAVAFSGGVDSTLLLKIAVDTLGSQKVLALTATSPLYPVYEEEESSKLSEIIGVRQMLIANNELELPEFVENNPRRCYHCKLKLFSNFLQIANQNGFSTLIEGSNQDDLGDYRPGRDALQELQVSSPLLEAGLYKAEIRQLSQELKLPTWNKQAFACLASRFPYGTSITRERLEQIERCENWLRKQNFTNFRVRYHHELARIEVPADELSRFLDDNLRQQLVIEFKSAGFQYITLDLQGYRTGSMNETL
ncbi:ATP-dependent sacrificial sulfur transferase LarE [Malonomonas rubra]|uniref:ATP-dependent sacrificial sulfur transferase LarE n=1 Tax=Malonomonas rubra TaxID=57040 RepID=UPI0026E9E2DA|nr:ATP-dependent sacrificial sulfur transferase LarE [Malonomonas rubra]